MYGFYIITQLNNKNEKYKWVDEKYKWVDEKYKWVNEKYKRVNEKYKWVNEKYKWVNEKYKWVDEWLLFIANFSAISWREQVNLQWDDNEVCFLLDQHAEWDLYRASLLKQQSTDRHVALLRHIILIPNQQVFACLSEKQQTPIA